MIAPSLAPLPGNWSQNRTTLQRVATHVVCQARQRQDGLFDLIPAAGGFATPNLGDQRQRIRISGGHLIEERSTGDHIRHVTTATRSHRIDGASINELCEFLGFQPDPAFWVGGDTPEPGDLDEPVRLDPKVTSTIGGWFLLGAEAIDRVIAQRSPDEPTLARVWPEHFDLGVDVGIDGDLRCNLGAAAGDGFHAEPYVYVGPWNDARPGNDGYWNAPFGAVFTYADLAATVGQHGDHVDRVVAFFDEGIRRLVTG